jgi:predicted PurR-regulated permease PerM
VSTSDRRSRSGRVTHDQRRALGLLTLAAIAAVLWLAVPVGLGLFLGTLVAFSIEPLFRRLCLRTHRPDLSAAALAIGCTLILAGALAALIGVLASRGASVAPQVGGMLSPGGTAQSIFVPLERAAERFGVHDLPDRLREAATSVVGRLAAIAAALVTLTGNVLLTLFFQALMIYFVLRHGTAVTKRAELVLPFHPMHTRLLFAEFERAGRSVFMGTMVTAIAQGVLAGIGYAIFHVPNPALLGVLTTVASFVPAIGTILVWGPVGAWLILTGHVGAGIGVLVWCLAWISLVCEYLVRPRLMGRGATRLPTVLTFIALFGGVSVFGVAGLIIGPVLVTLAVAVVRTWESVATLEAMGTATTAPSEARPDGTALPSSRPSAAPEKEHRPSH